MTFFAAVFLLLAAIIAVFQLVLALGAPLGEYTMGGKFPGKLPNAMKIAALVQIIILFFFAAIVMAKAEIAFESLQNMARIGIWFIVAFFVFGVVMNISSPSKKERMIMGPANVIALISTLVVALS